MPSRPRDSSGPDEYQRHPHAFFVDRPAVLISAVLCKFFAVVRGNYDDGRFRESGFVDRGEQPLEFFVDDANLAVVAVARIPDRRAPGTGFAVVAKQWCVGGFGVVGRMDFVGVDEQEERGLGLDRTTR